MLLYEYQKLIERDSSLISGIWKGLHITLHMLAAIFGGVCAIFFHILLSIFDMNCILYPKIIEFKLLTTTEENSDGTTSTLVSSQIPLDFIKSQWQDMNYCFLPLYNPLLSVIFGIVWTTFFMMCPKGGKTSTGLRKPYQIVVPAFMFSIIFAIISIIATQKLNSGMDSFTTLFVNESEAFFSVNESKPHEVTAIINTVFVYVDMCVMCSWLYTLCWICSFILIIIRCISVVDFQVIRVKVEIVGILVDAKKPKVKQLNVKDYAEKVPNNDDTLTQTPLSTDSYTSATDSFIPLLKFDTDDIDTEKTPNTDNLSPTLQRTPGSDETLFHNLLDDGKSDSPEIVRIHVEPRKTISFEPLTIDSEK